MSNGSVGQAAQVSEAMPFEQWMQINGGRYKGKDDPQAKLDYEKYAAQVEEQNKLAMASFKRSVELNKSILDMAMRT
jgi:hypothetical protein